MVETLKLDKYGDVDFNKSIGDFVPISGLEALKQKVWILLNTNANEMDWNTDIGLDMNEVRINSESKDALQNILQEYLSDKLGDQFVSINIKSININRIKRINHVIATVIVNNEGQQQTIEEEIGDDDNSAN